jgi:four helix bundle protein
MDKHDLENRTKNFAIKIIQFVAKLPKNMVADVLGRQLLRSGTSIGANYREANRAQSHADFINKIGIVEKETSETQYWLELCQESNIMSTEEFQFFQSEIKELLAIFTSIGKTAKQNRQKLGFK